MELTEAAGEVLGGMTEDPAVPDTAGLRICAEKDDVERPALTAVLTAGPGADDEVLEFGGVRVFVDPSVADRVSDRVLDAEVADDEVVFHIRRRTEDQRGWARTLRAAVSTSWCTATPR
jgi:Fe-S cluster assembly iron-binding protein IscA